MNSWQIGDVKVTRIIELEITGGTKFILPDASPEAVREIDWLRPHFADAEGNLTMSVHALIVETPQYKIIVDTCIGNDKKRNLPAWNNLQLPFLEDLKKAGYDRHEIDFALCTHLHVDHVGWNTMLVDGKWQATFPNARYLFAKPEFEYWMAQEEDDFGPVMEDSVKPVCEAGLVDLVELNHQVCEQVKFVPTLGHTPGHISIAIESQGQKALITGDAIHHPCQIARPEWAAHPVDFDSQMSTATRHEMLASYGDQDILVIGTHFPTPTTGHIKSSEQGYYLDIDL